MSGDIRDDIVALLHALVDLLSEVKAAQWALSLDLEPLDAAFSMKVVLLIAGEGHYLVVRAEGDQTNRAVWHVRVLLLILLVSHLLQTAHVALQGKFSRLLSSLK